MRRCASSPGETTVFVASGNHDLDGRDEAGEKVARWMAQFGAIGVHGDYSSVPLGDDLVTVCPWWDGPRAQATLDACLAEAANRPRRRWIWVHHAPPAGSPLAWDGRRAWGDDQLSGWIERFTPDLVLTGHVHQAPFVPGGGWVDRIGTTWVFNAGQQPGPVARAHRDRSRCRGRRSGPPRPTARRSSSDGRRGQYGASRSRSEPGSQAWTWWWRSDSRTVSTMPRLSWSPYWRRRSTR